MFIDLPFGINWSHLTIYIYGHPPPYDPPMCHLYCYLQHKMRIFSIPFLSSSYIVITIQYLKALWGRPIETQLTADPKSKKHRENKKKQKKNNIFRLLWGHSMKKTKKPWENQKNKKKKKKQYFQTLLGSLHEKTKKTLRKQKKKKKQKKQYFQTLLGSLHEKTKKTLRKPKKQKNKKNNIFRLFWGHSMKKPKKPWENQKKKKKTIFRNYLEGPPRKESLNICKYCFFCFFWFSQGFFGFFMEWPQKSLKILFFLVFFSFFGFLKVFLVFFMEWPQKIIRIWKLIISPIFPKCKHCLSLMHLPIRNWTVSNPNYCLDLSVIHASVQLQLSHFNSKLLPGSSHLLLRFF